MAINSTGISATWNGSTFSEVTDLSWDWAGGRVGRSSNWSPLPGTISIETLANGTVTTSDVGTRAAFTISGGGVGLTGYAILESFGAKADLNGVTRYTVTLSIHQ